MGFIISDSEKRRDTINSTDEKSVRRVSVGFFGSVREAASDRGCDVLLECEKTVYVFLKELADKYGETFTCEVFNAESPDDIREDVMITLNKKILHHAKTGNTVLQDNDKLDIFPIFPGGG